jgi:hypothetical protein
MFILKTNFYQFKGATRSKINKLKEKFFGPNLKKGIVNVLQ